jgi:RsiW-degrading membrane proteinase PrsW (M82 family)
MLSVAIALLPVVAFLAVLFMMDSFKLVPARAIVGALAAGGAAAMASLWAWSAFGLDLRPGDAVSFYVAPALEETLKASAIVLLLLRARAGFLVEAAVQGFAVGAGFAVVENVTYLRAFGTAPLNLWLVRGVGTAMLHGGTTAIFAIMARALADRFPRRPHVAFLPGLAAAIVIHSAFNQLPVPPLALAAVVMLVLPLLILVVFERSERATREWMGAGMDLDIEVLRLVGSEHFPVTRLGQYLHELRARFPGPIVANMYCLLRLELELSVHARATIMAREAGLDLPADDDLSASLDERDYLQHSIGRAGLIALRPLQVTSDRDRWHRQLLAQSRKRT